MTVDVVNPDSTMLNQVEGHWQKLVAVLVWKLAPKGVTLTFADLEKFGREAQTGKATLLTHGHRDSIELKIVTAETALRLAAYDAANRGHA